jgi:hypothetical protein
LADGLLTRGTQSDIYATIARQEDRFEVAEHPLPLLWRQLRVLLNRLFDLSFG